MIWGPTFKFSNFVIRRARNVAARCCVLAPFRVVRLRWDFRSLTDDHQRAQGPEQRPEHPKLGASDPGSLERRLPAGQGSHVHLAGETSALQGRTSVKI